MLIYASFFIGYIAVWFLNISVLNRGRFATSAKWGILGIPAGFIAAVILGLVVTDYGYTDVRYTHPIDSEVRVSIDKDAPEAVYSFESDGETVVLGENATAESPYVLIPTSGDQYYRKICVDTPDWVAPWTFGGCRTEIYSNMEVK